MRLQGIGESLIFISELLFSLASVYRLIKLLVNRLVFLLLCYAVETEMKEWGETAKLLPRCVLMKKS